MICGLSLIRCCCCCCRVWFEFVTLLRFVSCSLYGLVPVVVVPVDLGSGGGGGLGFAGLLVGVRGCVVFASSLLFWFAVGFA
ncbi:transmembrane protein, putative [Medicago truncatula]|uniref:Transmembrane protein, putative n=1 Tax=Medicago truncatula TaxID=3880 RepID=A0A072U9B4_MEDTR|nr:transmembrane protein, putative [Medicago truncatula]